MEPRDWISLAALGLSALALWRTHSPKALDWRVDLRKTEDELRRVIDGLPQLHESAKRSRLAINAPRGLSRSGNEAIFLQEMEGRLTEIRAQQEIRREKWKEYRRALVDGLEDRVVERHDHLARASPSFSTRGVEKS